MATGKVYRLTLAEPYFRLAYSFLALRASLPPTDAITSTTSFDGLVYAATISFVASLALFLNAWTRSSFLRAFTASYSASSLILTTVLLILVLSSFLAWTSAGPPLAVAAYSTCPPWGCRLPATWA